MSDTPLSDTAAEAPAVAEAAEAAAPELAIEIDESQFRIGDLRLFLRLNALKGRPIVEQSAALYEALPAFDRLVKGGVDVLPLSALTKVVEAVAAAMSRVGNPGN